MGKTEHSDIAPPTASPLANRRDVNLHLGGSSIKMRRVRSLPKLSTVSCTETFGQFAYQIE